LEEGFNSNCIKTEHCNVFAKGGQTVNDPACKLAVGTP